MERKEHSFIYIIIQSIGETEENTKPLGQNIRSSDRNFTPECPEIETFINHAR